MTSTPISCSLDLPDGKTLTIETGKLAKLAHGSALVSVGDTMLLATVVSKQEPEEQPHFLPLSIDYQERFASTGKIPGGFLKREGRLSDHEILISRLVDRVVRPLFPKDYYTSTQVNISLLSSSGDYPPDALAALAASAALTLSHIPFKGPISETRVAKINDTYCINPTYEELEGATLNLIVGASKENILMVEGEAREAQETEVIEALQAAHKAIQAQCALQEELLSKLSVLPEKTYVPVAQNEKLYERMQLALYDKVYDVAKQNIQDKVKRNKSFDDILNSFKQEVENEDIDAYNIDIYYKKVQKEALRNYTLENRQRIDGRSLEAIRPISIEVDYLPATHGSVLFTRGETQSLTTVTLGTKMNEQLVDGAVISGSKKFMLHYNFPGFSTSEVKPNRGPSRREIGHGNLAARALKGVLQSDDKNPYTIRVVSDILESNGSSSMATVCAASLALMDAGIPVERPVSGIAMGLLSKGEQHVILSDILGDEDQLGDMDFKIAGTEKGITACQMDIKVEGLSYEVLKEALEQARAGRFHILTYMNQSISASRASLKSHVPRVEKVVIAQESIGAVIGPSGKIIQKLQKDTSTTITVEQKGDVGEVFIYGENETRIEEAKSEIKKIVAVPTVGEIYEGIVRTIMPYGAFIEFLPGKSGLLHISEIQWERVKSMDGLMEENEAIQVKLVDIDKKTGKYRLSKKELIPKPE